MRIPVTERIAIEDSELSESFIRASGPGGQNVNKTSSAVQLRFDARHSPSLPDSVAARLIRLAGSRATLEGVIVITAERFRDQARNREDARARLFALIAEAATPPRPRIATRPTRGAVERRLTQKSRRAGVKAGRTARPEAE